MKIFILNLGKDKKFGLRRESVAAEVFYLAEDAGVDSVLYNVEQSAMAIKGEKQNIEYLLSELLYGGAREFGFARNFLISDILKKAGLKCPQMVPAGLTSICDKSDLVAVQIKPHYLINSNYLSAAVEEALEFDAKSILYSKGKPDTVKVILPKTDEYDFLYKIFKRQIYVTKPTKYSWDVDLTTSELEAIYGDTLKLNKSEQADQSIMRGANEHTPKNPLL